jgi:hypothetical protein
MNVLGASYPPSAGAFSGEAFIAVNDDASFLVRPGSPLCSRSTVTLPLPQTQSTFSVSTFNAYDTHTKMFNGQMKYYSLLHGMVDAFLCRIKDQHG